MAEDTRSVIINIPKRRAYARHPEEHLKRLPVSSVLKGVEKTRFTQPSKAELQKYTLMIEKPEQISSIKREELLLSYRMFARKQKRDKKEQKLAIKVYEKYKVLQTDLKRRLYLKDPPNEICTVIDKDKNYFSSINGRPLNKRIPIFKSLITATADLLRLKGEISYRNDAIFNVDTNQRNELKTYELSVNRCMKQVTNFDAFVSEDYLKSMAYLKKCDQLKIQLQLKVVELQNWASEQFSTISRLMGLDYQFHLQQKYGRFLYYLSPPAWRSKNREFAKSVEIEAKGFDLGQSTEEETFKVIFEQMQKECLNPVHPVLYFSEPHELIEILDGIEKQLLYNFHYITHLTPQKKLFKDWFKYLKSTINQETALVSSTVKEFERLLELENERCDQLKQMFFRTLHGLFYESVGSPEVLKMFVHLDFCHEKIFIERTMNMDILTIAKSLERLYMEYCCGLDDFHNESMKITVIKAINKERQKLKNAQIASRELRLFNRLNKQLQRAYEPILNEFKPVQIRHANGVPLTNKLNKADPKQKSTNKNSVEKPLTDSELEYLTLFTDWIEDENPDHYLHRINEIKMES